MGNSVFNTFKLGAVVTACALAATPVTANDTMDVLVGGEQLQITTASGASVIITFAADGTYTTSSGSTGTWTNTGDELCTVRAVDGAASCGAIPSGKVLGDSWVTKDGNGNDVTASIV